MIISPLSSVVSVTPGGSDGIFIAEILVEKVVSLIKQNQTGKICGNPIWAIQFIQPTACRTQPDTVTGTPDSSGSPHSIRPAAG